MFLAWFFFRSFLATIPLTIVGILFFEEIYQKKKSECAGKLVMQFKECIIAVSTNLRAGYAVENAFLESRPDMKLLFGEQSFIYEELELVRRGLVINISIEEQLADLAKRSGNEEITQFAQVFGIAKRNGGNLSDIIRSSAQIISRKIDTRQEIRTVLSGRRMEQNIMKVMPFAILAYIGFSYPGYFDGLYDSWQGRAIMTGCLVIYLAAYILGDRILKKIEKEMI